MVPTILVVSGFWLIVIVRGGVRLGRSAQPVGEGADVQSQDTGAPEGIPDLPANQPEPAPSVAVGALTREQEEFWTPLEETHHVDEVAVQSAADARPASDEEGLVQETAVIAVVDGAGANSGSPEEETDGELVHEPGDSAVDDRQVVLTPRIAKSRMVPSTDNVARRTGQPIRRTPPIPRSGIGEKDSVERADSI